MVRCEICGEPTSEETSKKPKGDNYFQVVSREDSLPGLGVETFEFCSVEHLKLFVS